MLKSSSLFLPRFLPVRAFAKKAAKPVVEPVVEPVKPAPVKPTTTTTKPTTTTTKPKPPKFMNGYAFFSQAHFAKVPAGTPFVETSRSVASEWKKLTKAEQDAFSAKAQAQNDSLGLVKPARKVRSPKTEEPVVEGAPKPKKVAVVKTPRKKSAYNVFIQQSYATLKARAGGEKIVMTKVMPDLSRVWKQLSEEERASFAPKEE